MVLLVNNFPVFQFFPARPPPRSFAAEHRPRTMMRFAAAVVQVKK